MAICSNNGDVSNSAGSWSFFWDGGEGGNGPVRDLGLKRKRWLLCDSLGRCGLAFISSEGCWG